MRDLNIFFKNSVEDLRFLLDKQYLKKPAIELVGNRYRLDHNERMILYRGVFDTPSIIERKKKCAAPSEIKRLIIDGYNVLITIESYLKGKTVFHSLDGYVRDIAGLYGDHTFDNFTRKSIDLLVNFIKHGAGKDSSIPPDGAFYLDYPVSKSGELAVSLRECFKKEKMNIEVNVVKNPDYSIIEEGRFSDKTVIATSDTVILDKIERSFDIPDFIIRNVFQKDILDLEMIMMQKSGN